METLKDIIIHNNIFADVDECASSMSTHGCQHICINTDGGFRCDCNSGFELNSDNSTCSGIMKG